MNPEQLLARYAGESCPASLSQLLEIVRLIMGSSDDLVIRTFYIYGRYEAVMLYINSLVNQQITDQQLQSFMTLPEWLSGTDKLGPEALKQTLLNKTVHLSEITVVSRMGDLINMLLNGKTIVAVEGLGEAFKFGARKIEQRAIEQPQTEQVVQGAREGFIEQLHTNLSLLRYRLPTPSFRILICEVGEYTKTSVAICYMEGIADPKLVSEAENRIRAIRLDGVLDAGYIEQFIEDHHYSPFPQVMNTEKPDKAVANLLEGRIVILTDGSPFALIIPAVFGQFFQTTEDYATRFLQGSFVRMARVIALVFSLVFPSLYVAIISFNPELIPTEFAVAVAGGRAGVPFPSFVEVLIMEISMEVLREASIRLPQQVGGALSIVGVLVVGQSAVAAGFASPITVVVIALTTIGSFATPAYNAAFALRMLRFPLILIAGMLGVYGVVIGLILIANHLLTIKSFGMPYLSPAVPVHFRGWRDFLIRAPLWILKKKPSYRQSRRYEDKEEGTA
ncbi:spore germination protein [Paenibacillus pinihumi]|uniref:spore germination protein n=1 Tax=Paenibacillus pinihumi TaxID=669462 RepID=UPI003CCBD56C